MAGFKRRHQPWEDEAGHEKRRKSESSQFVDAQGKNQGLCICVLILLLTHIDQKALMGRFSILEERVCVLVLIL